MMEKWAFMCYAKRALAKRKSAKRERGTVELETLNVDWNQYVESFEDYF